MEEFDPERLLPVSNEEAQSHQEGDAPTTVENEERRVDSFHVEGTGGRDGRGYCCE